jgi:hypothetical protein
VNNAGLDSRANAAEYGSHCYAQGQFVLPHLAVDQMQARVCDKLKDIGLPGFIAGFFTRRISRLVRWRAMKESR